MTELLCVDRGVPIFDSTLDGNVFDKTSNHKILSRISSIMASHGLGSGASIYVADAAMVTQANLEVLGDTRFISRLLATYDACKAAVAEAVDVHRWITLGELTQLPAATTRSSAEYRCYETSLNLYDATYRAVVIHSSFYDKRRQNKLQKRIVDSQKTISKKLKQVAVQYFCEADAQAAAAQIARYKTSLHQVIPITTLLDVRKRGCPPKGRLAPTVTRYQLSWEPKEQTQAIEREREIAGCFVLITTVAASGPSALAMILIIALMIWRLMERSMRLYLKETQSILPGWDNKPTTKPTEYMISMVFMGIQVVLTQGNRYFLKTPSARHTAFLSALGLDDRVFNLPKCRCKPIIPQLMRSRG